VINHHRARFLHGSLLSIIIVIGLGASSQASAVIKKFAAINYSINYSGGTATRSIKIQILRPTGVPAESLPAIIYSHGNAHGVTDGHKTKGQEWADFLASEGYLVINVEHRPLDENTDADLALAACDKVNLDATMISTYLQTELSVLGTQPDKPIFPTADIATDSECYYFQHLQHLRKRDVQVVYNMMDNIAKIANWWDGDKVALMGHSAGNAAVMTWAGAERTFLLAGNDFSVNDKAKFNAYISLSPQNGTVAPYIRGYVDDALNLAWDDVPQPVLSITGESDDTGVPTNISWQSPDARRDPFLSMKAGVNPDNKYLLWVLDDPGSAAKPPSAAIHNLMTLTAGNDDQKDLVKETVSAFLDSYVKGTGATLDHTVVSGFTGGALAEFCTFDLASSGDPAVCD